jgi:hypothetical protein
MGYINLGLTGPRNPARELLHVQTLVLQAEPASQEARQASYGESSSWRLG